MIKTYYDKFIFNGQETIICFEAFDHVGYWQIILS
jgi:hypothetical protein